MLYLIFQWHLKSPYKLSICKILHLFIKNLIYKKKFKRQMKIWKRIMITRIHVSHKVEKKLIQMEKQVKAPFFAAKRARLIIEDVLRKNRFTSTGKLAPEKDARLNKLYKFNLGSGYRLVCIREKYNFFFLFIGSHDACDAWLNRHSNKHSHKKGIPMKSYTVKRQSTKPCLTVSKPLNETENDHFLISKISEKILRKIFSGLVNNEC